VKIGPSAHWTKTEFDRLSEFLFAFCVKVSYKHGEAVGEDHKEDAFLGYDGDAEKVEAIEVEDIALDTLTGEPAVDEEDQFL
jgi:hypothetical protein